VVVARELADRGHDVVVTGGPAETRLCDELTRDPRITRAATDDLAGLADVVATARLLLCGDTGPAHLATADGTPSVLLFGPSDPRHWGPRVDGHLHDVLWRPAPGDPAGDPHGERLDPRLARVTVGDVLSAVDRLLGSAGGASLFAEPGDGLRKTL
jgi:ADP-heptose:LPS heptosyltransferase